MTYKNTILSIGEENISKKFVKKLAEIYIVRKFAEIYPKDTLLFNLPEKTPSHFQVNVTFEWNTSIRK